MSRLLKIAITLVVLVIAIIALGQAYPPVRLVVLKTAGRSPECPMEKALNAVQNERLQIKYKDEILAGSKLVRKEAGFHLWHTPMGEWWIPEGDVWMLPFNLAEQKRKIYGTGEEAVKAGDVVLDCGANIGVYTRVALDAGASKVVAIEPGPENVEALHRNFPNEIAAGRVIIVPKGVWDKDDLLTLQVDPTNTAANTFVMKLKDGKPGVQVPLLAIDKLVAELGLERVDYIKMDIEGAEQRALVGAQATLAKFHPRLALSAYHVADDPVKIPELVRKAWSGYQMQCGACVETPDFRIRPDVLFFR